MRRSSVARRRLHLLEVFVSFMRNVFCVVSFTKRGILRPAWEEIPECCGPSVASRHVTPTSRTSSKHWQVSASIPSHLLLLRVRSRQRFQSGFLPDYVVVALLASFCLKHTTPVTAYDSLVVCYGNTRCGHSLATTSTSAYFFVL